MAIFEVVWHLFVGIFSLRLVKALLHGGFVVRVIVGVSPGFLVAYGNI